MFAIQPTNRLYPSNKYIGVRPDSNLPYPVYEGSANFPKEIYDFKTKEAALAYLAKILDREGIDLGTLITSQIVDLMLISNADKFYIIEYEIVDDKIKVLNSYLQPQFTRKGWY